LGDVLSCKGTVKLPPCELVDEECRAVVDKLTIEGSGEESKLFFRDLILSPKNRNSVLEVKNTEFTGNRLVIEPGFTKVRFTNCSFVGVDIATSSNLELIGCNILGSLKVENSGASLNGVNLKSYMDDAYL
jgi:hypothetical protein